MKQVIFIVLLVLVSFLRELLPATSKGVYVFIGKLFIEFSVLFLVYIFSKFIFEIIKDKIKK